jgi:glycosyltransferase involved in cell wall biosynthesis
MRIWLITIGEPLPTDGPDERLLRTGILAGMLTDKGHEVLWWTSAFDHVHKTHRAKHNARIQLSHNYVLLMLHSKGYQRNISLTRLMDHRQHAKQFGLLAPNEAAPAVILCSMPTIELSCAAVQYATIRNIPIALDIRDLWPEIFVHHAPIFTRWLARLLLHPLFQALRWACSKATAITGITPPIVTWGLHYAGRTRSDLDRDFPFGYVERKPTEAEIERARSYWNRFDIGTQENEFIVCFFGSLGHQFDIDTVIEAARQLASGRRLIRFVICGTGDRFEHYHTMAMDMNVSNVVFPGWVGSNEIWVLMRLAKIGIAPYNNSKDFCWSLPNKTIEYLSAGLPILSSLTGELQTLLTSHDCGVTYEERNAKSLVSELISLYDDRKRLSFMASNSLRLYRNQFTADKVYNDMCIYLEQLAATPV